MTLHAIAIPPASGADPKGLLVGLHGWGANAQDLVGLASYLNFPDFAMLFPDGPFPHPHALGGRMWYGFPPGFTFLSNTNLAQQDDLQQSRALLMEWLRSLEATTGVPLERTFIAGFSQGGAMTLDVGSQLPVAGLLILSGYLHDALASEPASLPPVLMVHGLHDAVVPIAAARESKQAVSDRATSLDYHEYEMGHEIRPIVLEMIQSFVANQTS